MAGTRFDNIDASGFHHGEYVGYGRGTVWRIRKYGTQWEAIPRDLSVLPRTQSRIVAARLADISSAIR